MYLLCIVSEETVKTAKGDVYPVLTVEPWCLIMRFIMLKYSENLFFTKKLTRKD